MPGRREVLLGGIVLIGAAVLGRVTSGVEVPIIGPAATPTPNANKDKAPTANPTETPRPTSTPAARSTETPSATKDLSRRQPKNQQIWTSNQYFPESVVIARKLGLVSLNDPKESSLLAFDKIRKIVQPGWQHSAFQYEMDVILPELKRLGSIEDPKVGRCFGLAAAGIIERKPSARAGEQFRGVSVDLVTKTGLLVAMHSWDIEIGDLTRSSLLQVIAGSTLVTVQEKGNKGWFLIGHKADIKNGKVGVQQLDGSTKWVSVDSILTARIPVHYPNFDTNLGIDSKGQINTLAEARLKEVRHYRNPHLADAEDLIMQIAYPNSQPMTRRLFLGLA